MYFYYRDDWIDSMFMLIFGQIYQNDFYRSELKIWSVWQSRAAFGGQKLKKRKQTEPMDGVAARATGA